MLWLLVLGLLLGEWTWAQESRGSILGTVRDISGAVIPGAKVAIINTATAVAVTVETNDRGIYLAPYLLPGPYAVTLEMKGFKQFRRENLQLRVNDRLEVNVVLELGQATETVTVTAESPLLESVTVSQGQVVDARRISELPVPHGIPFLLVQLAPGVGCVGCVATGDSPYDSFSNSYAMAGTRAQRSETLVDGVPTSSTNWNDGRLITSWVPPADVVAEMKVQTATFDASVGNTEGGAINVSLKSGTNTPHGTGFYTKMAPELTANTFFSNRAGQPRRDFSYNRWGTTVGGPIELPNLYNGRDRTFFFYGYEAIHEKRLRGTTTTVPTPKQREGDFSDLLALGSRYQIYDPATKRALPNGRFQSDPLPGNLIPAFRISPIARKILSYYALPNVPGTAEGRNNLALPGELEPVAYYTHVGRVDHNISDRHRIFGRINAMKRDSVALDWFRNFTTARPFQFISRGGVLDDVYSVNPTLVINARYGYDRYVRTYDTPKESHGFDLTSLGLPQSYNDAIPANIRRFPYITIDGYQSTFNGVLWRPNDTHNLALNINQMKGTHALKYGAEYRIYREFQYMPDHESTGRLHFGTDYTRGPFDNSPAAPIGQGLASLLLGITTSGGYVDRRASYAEQSTAWGFYIHDDWKLTRKLTLNIGLRYELEGPLTERFNRAVRGFDPTAVLPVEAQVKVNYAANPTPELPPEQFTVRGGLTFPGVNGLPRTLWQRDKNNFLPRVGLAYSMTDKTVLRAGYGIYFGFLGTRRGDVVQTGFSQRTPLVPSLDGGLTFVATLANPFPDGVQEPPGASLGAATNLGQGITFYNPKPLAPYMQRWLFSIQRELPHRIVADVSYVGNRGTHIETPRDLNALPNHYLSTKPTRDTATINYLTANLPNPYYPLLPNTSLAGTIVSRTKLLTAYPHFGNVSTTTNEGYSWYHSLQAKVEKRFSSGYTVQGAYTWSKMMEATGFLNAGDPVPDRAISDQDFTHRIAVSGIYELPFGRKRRWGAGASGLFSILTSGWQAQGSYIGQSGQALGFGNVIFNGDLHNIPLPNSERTPERWFNTNASFERNSANRLDYNLRTFPMRFSGIRGDGLNQWDLSIIKNTMIRERVTLQFRGEALNALNHAMFSDPNTDPYSSAFGTITGQKTNPRRIQLTLKVIY